jgi:capsid protein
MWDGQKHIDPLKEANAQTVRLKNLTTTLADELAVEGKDWEDHVEQIAKERKKLAELGLSIGDVAPSAPAEPDDAGDDDEDGAVEATILRDESGRIIGATERRHRG